jgi:hypothetical protein
LHSGNDRHGHGDECVADAYTYGHTYADGHAQTNSDRDTQTNGNRDA